MGVREATELLTGEAGTDVDVLVERAAADGSGNETVEVTITSIGGGDLGTETMRTVTILDEMPLAGSGKVDRRTLTDRATGATT